MRLAIMQPYLFPYIGYFQLVAASDRFVFYDDVSFIKQGWINRNRILVGGRPSFFTVPVKNQSSNIQIRDTALSDFSLWRRRFLKTLLHSYKQCPFFDVTYNLIADILSQEYPSVGALSIASVQAVARHIDIHTQYVRSSSEYCNTHLKGQERVLDICSREHASEYLNPTGGIHLYSKRDFADRGVSLKFVRARLIPYDQRVLEFVSSLSIIDMLMRVSIDVIQTHLEAFDTE